MFVVARLAARHGIRVRLRPASMGGLTALVWLPDEVIAHETAATPPGLRRIETTGTGTTPTGAARMAEWPEPGQPEDRTAAMQAVNAARAPRFTPLRPDLGDTASFSALDADAGTPSEPDAAGSYDTAASYDAGSSAKIVRFLCVRGSSSSLSFKIRRAAFSPGRLPPPSARRWEATVPRKVLSAPSEGLRSQAKSARRHSTA